MVSVLSSKWVARISLALVAAGSALLVGEGAVRLLAPQPPSWLGVYRSHPRLPTYALAPDVDQEVSTGETHWHVVSDAEGFRTSRAPPERSDLPVALWLGDSFAFGYGVEHAQSFVGLIDRARPGLRHVNAAVAGYGPVQYRQVLEDLLEQGLEPSVVFVCVFVGNDFHDSLWNKDVEVHDGVLATSRGVKLVLKRSSHLYRLAAAAFHRKSSTRANRYQHTLRELADPDCWSTGFLSQAQPVFARELASLAQTCEQRGIAVHFVVLPTRDACEASRLGEAWDGPDHERPVREALSVLAASEVPALDTLPVLAAVDPGEAFFTFDGHLTPLGNRLVARAILRTWGDLGLQ